MHNRTAVSICIPTFNGEKFLDACIASAKMQTWQDFELLIVDDNSSDSTRAIIQRYVQSDRRIKYFSNSNNLGLVSNWNRCIELSKGEWIKFVFQDDLIDPHCIEEMLRACDSNTWIAVCKRRFIFESGTSEKMRAYYEEHDSPERAFGASGGHVSATAVCNAAIDRFGVNCFGEPTATLIRRQAFERYGLFNPDLAMICDLEYWIRIGIHHGFTYVPETLASFRVHEDSTSAHHFARRQYRMTWDAALLMHEYVYNPDFEPLRRAVKERLPPIDLKAQFEHRVAGARWLAIDAANNPATRNPELLREWENFVEKHPALAQKSLPNSNIFERLKMSWLRRTRRS